MSHETVKAPDEKKTPDQEKAPDGKKVLGQEASEPATKEVLSPGEGDNPRPGDTVIMHYTGTLWDGTVFDSSYDRGRPFETLIGCGKVIKAWDYLVPQMAIGEKANFKCPPETAYGSSGFPGKIPPNSTLFFEVELLGIRRMTNHSILG